MGRQIINAHPPKILVAEDDAHISGLLCELLTRNGYRPVAAYSGTEALLLLSQGGFSLVLLDLMLPGKTGEQVLGDIRRSSNIPVIVLTARTDKESTAALLRQGADDYVAKPFDNNELLARIEARLRPSNTDSGPDTTLTYKDLTLSLDRHDVACGGVWAGLSKREFEILHLLISHPQKVFSKNNLYESVWGEAFFGDDNTINVHISRLRAKLARAAACNGGEYIQTVWGIGFKMAE